MRCMVSAGALQLDLERDLIGLNQGARSGGGTV